jgi:hypothetical protein
MDDSLLTRRLILVGLGTVAAAVVPNTGMAQPTRRSRPTVDSWDPERIAAGQPILRRSELDRDPYDAEGGGTRVDRPARLARAGRGGNLERSRAAARAYYRRRGE